MFAKAVYIVLRAFLARGWEEAIGYRNHDKGGNGRGGDETEGPDQPCAQGEHELFVAMRGSIVEVFADFTQEGDGFQDCKSTETVRLVGLKYKAGLMCLGDYIWWTSIPYTETTRNRD